MANEVVITTLSAVTVASSGASAASNAFVSAGTLNASAHSGYTGSDLVLTGTMAASVASASNFFSVYARPLDIDSTNDAPAPGSSFTGGFVGALLIAGSAASGAQTAILQDVPNSWANVEFVIQNQTNAQLNAGWTLKAVPKTVKPL
jgi:hypothetical protein